MKQAVSTRRCEVGDIVETCSLLPGIVMKRTNNKLEVRILIYENGTYKERFSVCTIGSCGIVLLTVEQMITRLNIGKERLELLWNTVAKSEDYYQIIDKQQPVYAE